MELEERVIGLEREVAVLRARVFNRRHPSAWAIAEYWLSDTDTPFCTPGDFYVCHDFYRIQMPHCFRCDIWRSFEDGLSDSEKWNQSGRWLQKAHLVDRALGGPDTPDNMVMLCPECHSVMPSFDYGEKQAAIEWVLREDDDSQLAIIRQKIILNIAVYEETLEMAKYRVRYGKDVLGPVTSRELVVIHKVRQLF